MISVKAESMNKQVAQDVEAFLDELALSNHSVLGYHYPFYLHMLELIGIGEAIAFIARNDSGMVVGYMPTMVKESELGKVISSLPFFGPNAGVLCATHDVIEPILNCLKGWIAEQRPISTSIYTPFEDHRAESIYASLMPDALRIEKFTNFIKLDSLSFNSGLLYDLRKAEKGGVVVEATSDIALVPDIYAIYIRNCEDYGIPPKPYACVEELVRSSASNNRTATYIARKDGQIIGALIMIYSPITASYYLPCSIHEFRSLQPTSLLIHHAMMECKKRGLAYWNWEASPSRESGVYKFKKKWGSEDGSYSIFILPGRPKEDFAAWGQEGISRAFPFFFVYPFHLLK
jgi:hypothetical protein